MENIAVTDRRPAAAPDRHRPGFHFLPAKNWMNDPNGLIQWKGQYHLFYQYNPNGPFAGTIHWGHAMSTDLLHWSDLPIALSPTPGGPDAKGCWSGSAVDDKGVPTLIYTGIAPQVVCLATSPDDLVTWEKYSGNPVIAGPPAELAARAGGDFRDPFVWQKNGAWHMVMGSKIEGRGGVILRYRSSDLIHWEYTGVLLQGDATETQPFATGTMWECPNFFELGGQSILIFSVQTETHQLAYPVYYAGGFREGVFTPRAEGILVHGSCLYAPQVMHLADGRTIMFGWLKEGRQRSAVQEAGWAGVMSVPMTLAWMPDGAVRIAPVEELKALRRQHWHLENVNITPGSTGLLGDVQGDCLEIEAVFEPAADAEFGIRLACSPDGQEQTRLVCQVEKGQLVVERGDSSLSPDVDRNPERAPIGSDSRGQVRLHVFLDRSVLEVFANDDICLASRIYPTRPDSLGVALFATGGSVSLKSIDIWEMNSIW